MNFSNELEHYGVKGMRWGVRRMAKRDAKEFSRAKMFYGDGAGTRRKLIKAKVESNSKKIPDYDKAFEYYRGRQDMGKHATKATGERRRKDAKTTVAKTGRGIYHKIAGDGATTTATAALLFGVGSLAMTNPKIRAGAVRGAKKAAAYTKDSYSKAATYAKGIKIQREWNSGKFKV